VRSDDRISQMDRKVPAVKAAGKLFWLECATVPAFFHESRTRCSGWRCVQEIQEMGHPQLFLMARAEVSEKRRSN
jgi:hypothetical protein